MAVLLFGLCAMPAAQAQNTTSSIEKSKSESLWTSTTDNAAGGMIDAQEKYATANFGFEREAALTIITGTILLLNKANVL